MHKIATCCYCGTRAALVLRGETRHELSCAACGAPLHEMKAIPQPRRETSVRTPQAGAARPGAVRRKPSSHAPKPSPRRRAVHRDDDDDDEDRYHRRRPRRRKPLLRKALEEIWDVVEDILD